MSELRGRRPGARGQRDWTRPRRPRLGLDVRFIAPALGAIIQAEWAQDFHSLALAGSLGLGPGCLPLAAWHCVCAGCGPSRRRPPAMDSEPRRALEPGPQSCRGRSSQDTLRGRSINAHDRHGRNQERQTAGCQACVADGADPKVQNLR
jgi:hypothetical protein